MVHDVFGREKHKLHSDNMGGVGSFEKDCRTLYVGRLGKHKDLENILWKEFGEWGEVEVLDVISFEELGTVNLSTCNQFHCYKHYTQLAPMICMDR